MGRGCRLVGSSWRRGLTVQSRLTIETIGEWWTIVRSNWTRLWMGWLGSSRSIEGSITFLIKGELFS
jgi:hypothetical protein